MNRENVSKVQDDMEETSLFANVQFSVVEKVKDDLKIKSLKNNTIKCDTFSSGNNVLDEHSTTPENKNFQIPIWRNRKILIKKPLIPVRIAFFFWFASGSLFSPFFVLMLTHRGLVLTEFTSVFSLLFLAQLTLAYVCGIVADKLGNAKPVLIFLMLSALCVIISLLLSPDVRNLSCLEQHANATCLRIFNYTTDVEYCKHTCSRNNTKHFTFDVYHDNSSDSIVFSEGTEDLSSNEMLPYTPYSNSSLTFCDEICFCLNRSANNCSDAANETLKIIYSVLILCFYSLWSTSYRFLDFASINLAKEHNSHFGKERMFGQCGALFSTIMCNFVLQMDKSGTRGYYDNVFWFAVLMGAFAVISACNVQKFLLPPGLKLSKKTLKLFTDIEIVSLILVGFAAGIAYSFNSFYHLWFLNSLKASKVVVCFHIMSNSIYSLPLYATSKWWIKKLGIRVIIIISLLGYAINGISYSFLYRAWPALIIEVTKAFSYYLFWIALVVHCREIAPDGFAATINSVVGTIHTGVGRSFSVSVGGILLGAFGARTTYRILSSFCLISAILYSTFLYIRHLLSKKAARIRSADPEEMKSMKENED